MTDTATWLAEQITAHDPDHTEDPEAALRLAEACAALAGGVASAFGLSVIGELPEREALRSQAIDALKRWIKQLDGDHIERLKKMIGEYRLAIPPG